MLSFMKFKLSLKIFLSFLLIIIVPTAISFIISYGLIKRTIEHEIFVRLKDSTLGYDEEMEHAKRAKATENQMDNIYLESLANLFDNIKNTTSHIMKMRELYRHLKRATNSCDDATNIISDIIVKT